MKTSFSRTAGADGYSVTSHVSANLLQFLNGLPIMAELTEWIDAFREGLGKLLGDVDRIVVKVNLDCNMGALSNIRRPSKGRTMLQLIQHSSVNPTAFSVSMKRSKPYPIEWEEFLHELRTFQYPVHKYQRPCGFSYHTEGNAYLGTILLFRRKGGSPISERTISTMKALEPFIIFLLSSLITRHVYRKPYARLFGWGIDRIGADADLTTRELEVMGLYLFGLSHREIANRLFISEHTVQKHVKSIHRKTGARNFVGLMSRVLFGEESAQEQLGLHERRILETG